MGRALLAFVPVALVMIMTPGPDTLMIVKHASRGIRAGAAAIAGVLTGLTVHGTAAVVGLSALLATSAEAFLVVKLLGAAYLCFLGVRAIVSSIRGTGGHTAPVAVPARNSYRQALLCNLMNPKIAVFFVAFIPQFVRHDAGWVPGQTALLAASFLILTGVWFAVLTVSIARARSLMDNVTVRRWIDRVAGTAFVGFGLRLAVAARG